MLLLTTTTALVLGFLAPRALSMTNSIDVLQKRDGVDISCSSGGIGGSELSLNCNGLNKVDENGLKPLVKLYFALANTNIPDDTVYKPREYITCISKSPANVVQFEAHAGVEVGPFQAGTSVKVNFTVSGIDSGGLCIFPEGVPDKDQSDNVTLAQARRLVLEMIQNPKARCESCGRIPLRFLDKVTDATDKGGILKADFVTRDNCVGKCVGPLSFILPNSSASASSTAKSAAGHLKAPELFGEFSFVLLGPLIMAFAGSAMAMYRL